MGWSPSGHYNAYQKELLGWLSYGAAPPITTVQTDGTYLIDAYASQSSSPKALKILKATDPVSGRRTWYYLEYRQAIGFDSVLSSSESLMQSTNVLNGVIFHTNYEGNGGNSGYLLDMTPETYQLYTRDPALEVGESFVDPDGGATITTIWVDSSFAEVSVTLEPQACMPANPTVALSPSESLWVEPGTPVTYTLTVTNRDSAACNNAGFDLLAGVPAGWTASFGTAALTLAPGASGTTTLDVASPVSEADGFYDITVTVENANDPAFVASAGATYVVSAAVNQPPVASNDSAATVEDTPVTIAVLANDWDPDSDTLTVTSVTQGANGAVTINAGGSVTYTPGAGFTGTDSFGYTVSDGQGGSASATVTVTVNAALNAPPVAVDDSSTTAPGTPVTIPVLANDSDPDGDTLTVVAATQGAKGTVAVNADGTITYTPGRKAKGSDSFTYTIEDGTGNAASATVSVLFKNAKGGGGNGGGGNGGGKGKKK